MKLSVLQIFNSMIALSWPPAASVGTKRQPQLLFYLGLQAGDVKVLLGVAGQHLGVVGVERLKAVLGTA